MIYNLVDYTKNNLFEKKHIHWKVAVISDSIINTHSDYEFIKINTAEQITWTILAAAKNFDQVFVLLDRLNWDSIFRVYKSKLDNISVLNLNSWFSGIWKKVSSADLDDVYLIPYTKVYEPIDIESLAYFTFSSWSKFVRVPNIETDYKIWEDKFNIEYNKILNLAEFWIQWYSWCIISFGSTFASVVNAVWLFQSEWTNFDCFWLWYYNISLNTEVVKSFQKQDKIFVVGDCDINILKLIFEHKMFEAEADNIQVYYITPVNLKLVEDESISEQVKLSWQQIYNRIYQLL